MGHAGELLVVGAQELADDARVEPGLLAADEARHALAPREGQRLGTFGDVGDAVLVQESAGFGVLQANRGRARQDGSLVGKGLAGLFAAMGDLRGDFGGG